MKNYLIQKLTDEGRFFQDVDGYYYFDLGEGQGALATHNLRAIADELDRLNKETPKHLPAETADKLNTALRKFLLKVEQPSMSGENITVAAWALREFLNDRRLLRELQAAAIEHQKQFPSTSVGQENQGLNPQDSD